jgi:hypothetical protein
MSSPATRGKPALSTQDFLAPGRMPTQTYASPSELSVSPPSYSERGMAHRLRSPYVPVDGVPGNDKLTSELPLPLAQNPFTLR